MAIQTTLEKNYVVENGAVKITETVEKHLSKEELLREKMGLIQRQQQILNQINSFRVQYSQCETAITEVDEMIAALGADEIV